MATLTSHQRCLIVHDDRDGASLLSDVEAAGFEAAGPFNTSSHALDWLDAYTPDVAVIAPALDESVGAPLVQALRSRGVPLVVYSDAARQPEVAPELQSVPWFEKCTGRADLLATLTYLKATLVA